MTRFDDLLTNAFDEIADRAVPSSSALVDFRVRAEQIDQQREVVVMLTPADPRPVRPRWLVPSAVGLAAASVLAVVGAIVVRSGADDEATLSGDDASARPAVERAPDQAEPEPPAPQPAPDEGVTESEPEPESDADAVGPDLVLSDWAPVLGDLEAAATPAPAACPEGSVGLSDTIPVPDELESSGPIDTVAAFDPSSHSIVIVRRGAYTEGLVHHRDAVAGRLDVCTGEWSPMSADFGMLPADPTLSEEWPAAADWPTAMAYDVDSGALVAFTHGGVRVYDPVADAWSLVPDAGSPFDLEAGPDVGLWVDTATYHPASGRIIVYGGFLAAYDVDTGEWQEIGYVATNEYPSSELLGLDEGLDRLVVAVGEGNVESAPVHHVTRLVDPVTGEATDLATPDRPWARIVNAFGPAEVVGQADGTVFVSEHEAGTICGFDATTLAWDACIDAQVGDGTWALVGDPINDLLVLVPPTGTIRTVPLP